MTNCIFYGGKGGVGKTTCAAATGVRLAADGTETLVVSTDPAHSLADSLGTPIGPEPEQLDDVAGDETGSLWAVEIDPDVRKQRYEKLARALAADLRSAGITLDEEEVERIFAAGAPAGSDELAALDLLVEYVDSGQWGVVIFDTAPTGHTLRLFDTPEVMGLALETTRSLQGQIRRIGTAARSAVLGPMSFMTGNTDEADLETFQARLERAREILVDSDRTAFRVVLHPEGMAIAESERLVDQLRAAEVSIDQVIVNRVFEAPDDDCSRCRSRHDRHMNRVAEIRETFAALPIVTLPELDGEVQGRAAVRAIADRLSQ